MMQQTLIIVKMLQDVIIFAHLSSYLAPFTTRRPLLGLMLQKTTTQAAQNVPRLGNDAFFLLYCCFSAQVCPDLVMVLLTTVRSSEWVRNRVVCYIFLRYNDCCSFLGDSMIDLPRISADFSWAR